MVALTTGLKLHLNSYKPNGESGMNVLANLKLVTSKRKIGISPEIQRRHKLSNKIWEQIQLIQAQNEGRIYAPVRLKTVKNAETGERRTIESPKRVREWWHVSEGGKIHLVLKYGSKQITFDPKGTKNAIEVANKDEMLAVFESLKQAVEAGALDAQIEAVSGALRAGFLK